MKLLNIKKPEEDTQRFTISPPKASLEAHQKLPCFAVRIRRKQLSNNPLQFALITQKDALELLRNGGSLAFWKGGSPKKPTVYFKLLPIQRERSDGSVRKQSASSVSVGRWIVNCRVKETCSETDRNPLNLLRSNLKALDCGLTKIPGREATSERLMKLAQFKTAPIVWSDYLVESEAIDLQNFTYQDHV